MDKKRPLLKQETASFWQILHFLIHSIKMGEMNRSVGEVKSQRGEVVLRMGERLLQMGERHPRVGDSALFLPYLMIAIISSICC